jgi:hypothetical protein
MKDKLTIEHLAAYLPYGLKGIIQPNIHKGWLPPGAKIMLSIGNFDSFMDTDKVKSIFRPLSDLTKDFFWNNLEDGDVPIIDDIDEILKTPIGQRKYAHTLYLLKHHFDIHDLIKKGLAIDIKTIENNSK